MFIISNPTLYIWWSEVVQYRKFGTVRFVLPVKHNKNKHNITHSYSTVHIWVCLVVKRRYMFRLMKQLLPPYPRRSPRYPLERRLEEPQSRSGQHGEEKILDPTRTWNQNLGGPARNQSLYRLRYPSSYLHLVPRLITHCYIASRKYISTACCLIGHRDKFTFNLFTSLYHYYIRHCPLLEVQTIQHTAFLK
jgi:hypothetical protein